MEPPVADTQEDLNVPEAAPGHEACVEQLKRERADFLNYKRRVDRERGEEREKTRQDVLRELLPAIDDLDRALAHLPPDLRGHPWVQGVSLARVRFLDALRRLGVERVGSEGERFDPSVHEAVVYHGDPSTTEQWVQSVVQPGYRLGSRLLRPAQVVVSGPAEQSDNDSNGNGRHHHDGKGHRN
jgi:molecular chaperone GrpE